MTQRDFGRRRCREQRKPNSRILQIGLLIAVGLTIAHLYLYLGEMRSHLDSLLRDNKKQKPKIVDTEIMEEEPVNDDEITRDDSIDVLERVILRLATDAGEIGKADRDSLTNIIEGELR